MIHQKLCPTCNQPLIPVKDGILFDEHQGTVSRAGYAPVVLTKTKTKIFALLFKHYGNYVHVDVIWNVLYGARCDARQPDSDNVIRVHINRLRPQVLALGLVIDARYYRGYKLELVAAKA